MANGLLGKVVTTANSNVTAYTVPSSVQFSTISIAAVNTGSTAAHVRIAITTAATPSAADYIEYEAELPASGGVLERTCIVCSANEKVMIFSDTSSVSVRVFGLEQA